MNLNFRNVRLNDHRPLAAVGLLVMCQLDVKAVTLRNYINNLWFKPQNNQLEHYSSILILNFYVMQPKNLHGYENVWFECYISYLWMI